MELRTVRLPPCAVSANIVCCVELAKLPAKVLLTTVIAPVRAPIAPPLTAELPTKVLLVIQKLDELLRMAPPLLLLFS